MIQHTIKGELKGTIALGMPLVLSQSMYACSPFIATAMVARLGEDALAANVLVYSAYMALSVLFVSTLNAVGILVSHQYGAKNEKAISEIMGQAFLLGAVICVLLMVILAFAPYFLNWHTQPLHVVQLAHELLRSLIWTIPGLIVWSLIQQCLEGMGHTKLIFVVNLIAVPVEILVIYCLIFGKLGFPAYHIAGVGYGLAISYTIAVMAMIGYLIKSQYYINLKIFTQIGKTHATYLKELIRIGLPMGFGAFIEVSAFAIITLWMARFGTTMLAAHQVVMQYLGFFIVMVFAFAQTVAIRVGHAVGRQDLVGVHYATYVGAALSFLCTLILVFAFYFFPQFFLSIDINVYDASNADLVHIATQFFSILSVFLLIESIRLILGFGALRGLKDTHFSMLVSLFVFWIIGLSTSFLFAFVFHLTGAGLWWGLTLGIGIGAVAIIIRWYYLMRRINLKTLVKVANEPQS
jgi:multidrug resistance protein, MATE family